MSEKASFVSRVRPITISLASASADLDRKQYWTLVDAGPLDRGIIARYELSDQGEDHFNVLASFEFVVGKLEQDSSEAEVKPLETPVRVSCRFEGHFHVEGEFERSDAEQFTEGNAWLIFWPFFRQYVSDATARMAIPPEMLPLGIGPGRYALGRERRRGQLPEKRRTTKKAVKRKA